MALTEEERETLDNIKETVVTLQTVLLGANSDEGLVGTVKRIASEHNRLAKYFWMLIALLVGSGIIAIDKLGIFGG